MLFRGRRQSIRQAWILVAILLLPAAGMAQNSIPPGTLLPVTLDTGLNSAKARPGQQIRARVMQDVPGTPVRRHNLVIGRVIRVEVPRTGQSRLEISFDRIQTRKKSIPIHTSLRAMASMMAVEDAKFPEQMADRSIPPDLATTEQIGGEQVYRGGGPVASGFTNVGTPVPYGVEGVPRPNPERGCRGTTDENNRPQALWLFSTDACGLYGLAGIQVEHRGRSEPVGSIELGSAGTKVKLSAGTALLLRVEPEQGGHS